jgi:hypothetical protein
MGIQYVEADSESDSEGGRFGSQTADAEAGVVDNVDIDLNNNLKTWRQYDILQTRVLHGSDIPPFLVLVVLHDHNDPSRLSSWS